MDKSDIVKMDQREAWEVLSFLMRSGAVDIGVRESHANNALANTNALGAGLNWLFTIGCLAVPVVFFVWGWKIGLAFLACHFVLHKIIGLWANTRLRAMVTENRIMFHTLLDTDSIRPRIDPSARENPLDEETLWLLVLQSRPR